MKSPIHTLSTVILVLLITCVTACSESSSPPTLDQDPDPATPDTSMLDTDMDGWTPAQGDCNDNDVNSNPGAVEVMTAMGGTAADEDCDTFIDEIESACDAGLTIDDSDAVKAANALGLCQTTTALDDQWGVISTSYTRANGSVIDVTAFPAHGLLPDFGDNVTPQTGSSMLVLSSGHARDAADTGACGVASCTTVGAGTPPAGFPQNVPGCAGNPNINDDIAYEITLKAPTNATGFSIKYNFYSHEWPEWVCTSFNDQFVIIVDPPVPGAINGNIAFDAMANPVSVNIAGMSVCDPADVADFANSCMATCPTAPDPYCPLGNSELAGTDFAISSGATSWLTATAPVTGGQEFTIKFIIWDTGDQNFDSTVLIDGWEWIANAGSS